MYICRVTTLHLLYNSPIFVNFLCQSSHVTFMHVMQTNSMTTKYSVITRQNVLKMHNQSYFATNMLLNTGDAPQCEINNKYKTRYFLTFGQFPGISLPAVKFPDNSRLFRLVVTMYTSSGMRMKPSPVLTHQNDLKNYSIYTKDAVGLLQV